MDELNKLIEKLKLIEALHAGASTEGERVAAGHARQRIQDRIAQHKNTDPPCEYKFQLNNMWSRRLLLALLRRYDIKPYRRYRQHRNTVMANVSKGFVNNTLWPEFLELDKELREHLDKVAERVISEAIYADSSDAEEVNMLPFAKENQAHKNEK
jgi:hypothetical protein